MYNPREYRNYLKSLSDVELYKEWDRVIEKYFRRKEKKENGI